MYQVIILSWDEWVAEAQRRYGSLLRKIRFVCPSCGFAQTGEDFLALGMNPQDAAQRVGFSCIGRWKYPHCCQEAFSGGPGPCNYAGGGLLRVAPILVQLGEGREDMHVFDFADEPLCQTISGQLSSVKGV